MRLGGRVQAAIEVLDDIEKRKRPASDALKDWCLSHRFAGSGDRAAIGNLVYDVLRRKKSLGYRIGADTSHSLVLSLLNNGWDYSTQEIADIFRDDKFAPESYTQSEIAALGANDLILAAPDIQADIPEWCCQVLKLILPMNGLWRQPPSVPVFTGYARKHTEILA